jgi:hypothetical protein
VSGLAAAVAGTRARWWPPRGPCACCAGGDARHRVWDMMLGRARAGDSVRALARDYGVPEQAVLALRAARGR